MISGTPIGHIFFVWAGFWLLAGLELDRALSGSRVVFIRPIIDLHKAHTWLWLASPPLVWLAYDGHSRLNNCQSMHGNEWELPESLNERLIDWRRKQASRKRGRLGCPMAVVTECSSDNTDVEMLPANYIQTQIMGWSRTNSMSVINLSTYSWQQQRLR